MTLEKDLSEIDKSLIKGQADNRRAQSLQELFRQGNGHLGHGKRHCPCSPGDSGTHRQS